MRLGVSTSKVLYRDRDQSLYPYYAYPYILSYALLWSSIHLADPARGNRAACRSSSWACPILLHTVTILRLTLGYLW